MAESVRLLFEFEGDQIRLVDHQAVDVVPPPSAARSGFSHDSGFWLEVRSGRMDVLHREILHDPIDLHPEVFAEDGKTISRSSEPRKKGAFAVLVPELPDGDHLAFVRSDPASRSLLQRLFNRPAAREVARFSLGKVR